MFALRLNSETFPPSKEEARQFADAGIRVSHQETLGSPALMDQLPMMDALLVVSAKVNGATIRQLERCRVIARYGIGVDNIDVQSATESGIVVTNVPHFCLSEVADHTMALILATARKLKAMDLHTRSGRWQARMQEKVLRISGQTLGLIGFGGIAQQVARRAAAFDLKIVACDPFFDHSLGHGLDVRAVELPELLQLSDFVSLHAPLTPQTHHMIGEPQLRRMKPNAILVNTARGGLVDEIALVQALREGWIAGAGIDVYESLAMFDLNPIQTDHALFALQNVVLTPHTAACSQEALAELMLDGAHEAITVLRGITPRYFVNPNVIPRFPFASLEVAR